MRQRRVMATTTQEGGRERARKRQERGNGTDDAYFPWGSANHAAKGAPGEFAGLLAGCCFAAPPTPPEGRWIATGGKGYGWAGLINSPKTPLGVARHRCYGAPLPEVQLYHRLRGDGERPDRGAATAPAPTKPCERIHYCSDEDHMGDVPCAQPRSPFPESKLP